MADVKWIKITTDIFDDEKILLIESLPDSYAIITVWFKLLCLAGKQNNSGVFMMGKIAYTDKMLATIFRMKEATVTMALQTFVQFGMIEIIDGVITIPNWGKHQSLDQLESKKEYMKGYMREYREKQKRLTSGKPLCKTNSKTNSKANVSQADKEEERNEDIREDNMCITGAEAKHTHGAYNNVLLTDDEFKQLQAQFPNNYEALIEKLSKGIATYGYKYNSHYLAILQWVENDEKSGKPQSFKVDEFFEVAVARGFEEKQTNPPKTAADDEQIRERAEALRKQFT